MSAITFEIKKEHLLLLKNLRWSVNKDNVICNLADEGDDIAPPFGSHDLYEAIDLILNGKPSGIDALTHDEFPKYSTEQKAEWDKLYSELPMALDIILYRGSFELGNYKTRYHLRNWVKNI